METLEVIQIKSKKIIGGDLKIIFVFLSLMITVSSHCFTQIVALITFSILSIHAAGREFLKLMKIPTIFLIPTAFGLMITEGKPIIQFGWFAITEEGIKTALAVLIRVLASFSILAYLILTTSIPEMVAFLKRLKLPSIFVELSLLIYRNIQILLNELKRLETSSETRLGNISKRAMLRTSSMLAYTIFLKTLDRSKKLELAMNSRCYSGHFPVKSEKSYGYPIATLCIFLLIMGWFVHVSR